MKRFLKILSLTAVVLIMGVSVGTAQNFTTLTAAFKTGNSKEIAKYLDTNVEVTIINKEANYSKMQAEIVLRDFFSSNTPRSYKEVHNGSSGAGAKYQIGELATSTGTYRTYLFIKQKGSSWLVQEVRIEKN